MENFFAHIVETALKKAKKAGEAGEIPVCAVVFDSRTKEIVSIAVNRTERDGDPTAHAEILALREACRVKGEPRLPDLDIYVTLEPCPMCAAAISFARIGRLYFGAYDVKGGGVEHGCRLYSQPTCTHKPEVYGGFGERESAVMLKEFFAGLRNK